MTETKQRIAICVVALGLAATSVGCERPERENVEERLGEAERDVERDVGKGEGELREEGHRIGEDTRHELRDEREAVDRGELRGIERAQRALEDEHRRVEEDLQEREAETP